MTTETQSQNMTQPMMWLGAAIAATIALAYFFVW